MGMIERFGVVFASVALGFIGALVWYWAETMQPCSTVRNGVITRASGEMAVLNGFPYWTHLLAIHAERLDDACSHPELSLQVEFNGSILTLDKSLHGQGVRLNEGHAGLIVIQMRLPAGVVAVQSTAEYTGALGFSRPPTTTGFIPVPKEASNGG